MNVYTLSLEATDSGSNTVCGLRSLFATGARSPVKQDSKSMKTPGAVAVSNCPTSKSRAPAVEDRTVLVRYQYLVVYLE
jgi:hypothetical protein